MNNNESEVKMIDPFVNNVIINRTQYIVTQEAIEDYRAFFGQGFSVEEIVEKLVQIFPDKRNFTTSDVLRLVKES